MRKGEEGKEEEEIAKSKLDKNKRGNVRTPYTCSIREVTLHFVCVHFNTISHSGECCHKIGR